MRGVGTLIVAILAFIVAYSSGRREVLVVAAAALLLVLGGLLVTRIRRPRLDVVRLFSPPVVSAGTNVRVTLRIQNKGAGPSPHLVWNDAIPWQEAAEPNDLLPIGGNQSQRRLVTVHYELHPPRRGLYQIGPLVVEHDDPFGMARSTVAVGQPDRLVVVPAIVDLPAGRPDPGRRRGHSAILCSAVLPATTTTSRLASTARVTRCDASTGEPLHGAANSWCGRRSTAAIPMRTSCSTRGWPGIRMP